MRNIHILPTNKPSRLLWSFEDRRYYFVKEEILFKNQNELQNQNIYITSDEEIKRNDYTLYYEDNSVIKVNSLENELNKEGDYFKKIILTTDQSLDGVQAIPDEFLEWFVKNPSCEEVGVTYHRKGVEGIFKNVKSIRYYGLIIPKKEPKQETLEEFIESYVNKIDRSEDGLVEQCLKDAIKWQQERSYSEEDMYWVMNMAKGFTDSGKSDVDIINHFEQFKKK